MTMVTGLVFDLPRAAWMDTVARLRERHEPARLRFPVEITVAGSSGLGWFSEHQTSVELVKRVAQVAQGFPPFAFRFASVERFPDSGVYYLAPHDDAAFHEFQRRLAGCGLRFEPTQYAYVPHCTVAILAPDATAEAHAEVKACAVPVGELQVSSVSFWSVDRARGVAQKGECIALGN